MRIERHGSLLISVGIIFPTESNLVILEGHEAVVGDGDAIGVAGEIAEHMMRTTAAIALSGLQLCRYL